MSRKALVALVLFGFAVGAGAPPASAGPLLEGIGVVWAKDLAHGTVTIGKNVYRVTNRTALSGLDGQRLAMIDIPVARDQNGWLRGVRRATVEYSAVGYAGALTLDSLRLIDPPR